MQIAANYNLEIVIGDTFSAPFTFYEDEACTIPYDLSTSTFKAQVRRCKANPAVLLEFVSPTTIDMSLAASGNITLRASSASTSLLAEQNAVYDLVWTNASSEVTTVVEGSVSIIERVTKP